MNTQLLNLGKRKETITGIMGTLSVQVPNHFWAEMEELDLTTKKARREFFQSKTINDYAIEGNLKFEINLEHEEYKKAFMELPLEGYETLFADPNQRFYLSFDITPISGKKYPEIELSQDVK